MNYNNSKGRATRGYHFGLVLGNMNPRQERFRDRKYYSEAEAVLD